MNGQRRSNMYDDLLGPRKPKIEEKKKINLKRKYKLDVDSPPPIKEEDPWAGAGEDLSGEEEETVLILDDEEYGDLDEEIEKALQDLQDLDDWEEDIPEEECEGGDSCMDCDGCDDDELDPSQDIGC
jgi:hypothetical protein